MRYILEEIINNLAEEKLSTGQHKTAPKGYPEDPSMYAVPEYYMFPLDTKKRVKSAIAYFGKHDWKKGEHKKRAALRILAAAKKFDIEVSKDTDVYKTAHGK